MLLTYVLKIVMERGQHSDKGCWALSNSSAGRRALNENLGKGRWLWERMNESKSKLRYDRQSVGLSRPVRLGVRHPSGTRHQFFFLLEIFFRQLRVCYFVRPSLTRGRVCNLAGPRQSSSARVWVPRDSRPYFIVPILEIPPTWSARSPYLYPPGTGWHSVVYFISNRLTLPRLRYFFYPEDGRNTFLWNVSFYKTLTAPHPRRRRSL
jgi:hypothetical protein